LKCSSKIRWSLNYLKIYLRNNLKIIPILKASSEIRTNKIPKVKKCVISKGK
jgi:hypothetical protein